MAEAEITLKELFERLVVMETKLTAMSSDSKNTKRLFQNYVFIMVILLVANIFLHVFGVIR